MKKRSENFDRLYHDLQEIRDLIILPEACSCSKHSWFGFLITCKGIGDRDKVVRRLEEKGIQTRMLFAGNLIKHPCFDFMRNDEKAYRVVGNLKNTDTIMNSSFWVGVYPGMSNEMIDDMAEKIIEAVKSA